MNQLKKSIIATLCYSDIFDFPLTKNELYQNLCSDKPIGKTAFNTAVTALHQNGNIRQTGSYFHLPNRASIIRSRIQRQTSSRTKQQRAKMIAAQLIHLPYVEAVILTGAVAVNNAPSNDDIDIMIITAPQSMWTCRLIVNSWLDVQGLRRHPHSQNVKDKICANLFLSSDALKIPRNRQNNYTAHEIVQSIPLADPYHLYADFIAQNRWINRFLPHITSLEQKTTIKPKQKPFFWMETLARNLQLIYMNSKRTREIVTPNAAFFHPRNTAAIVQAQYERRLKDMKI